MAMVSKGSLFFFKEKFSPFNHLVRLLLKVILYQLKKAFASLNMRFLDILCQFSKFYSQFAKSFVFMGRCSIL